MNSIYSIFVIFFQKGLRDGITFHTILCKEEHENILFGHTNDLFGDSKITNFQIGDTNLSFIKEYEGRPPIKFSFVKTGGFWTGFYKGEDCGVGKCNCTVSALMESFFLNY